jgi:hypothetical protein
VSLAAPEALERLRARTLGVGLLLLLDGEQLVKVRFACHGETLSPVAPTAVSVPASAASAAR